MKAHPIRKLVSLVLFTGFGGLVFGGAPRAAGAKHDVDVYVVTDMTKEGREVAPAAPDKPVYYMILDLGPRSLANDFSAHGDWPGVPLPPKKAAREWVMDALATKGYRIADMQHPPTQFLVYAWGLVPAPEQAITGNQLRPRPALGFLGGDKLDLMWELEPNSISGDPRRLRKKMGLSLKLWNDCAESLFLARVRSLTIDSAKSDTKTLLWETRFGCPAEGLTLGQALPLMIKAAAPQFGEETAKPVNINATKLYGGDDGAN